MQVLKDLLTNISKELNARLELRQMSERDQQHLEEAHNKKIKTITDECVQVRNINISYICFLVKAKFLSC